MVCGLRIIAGQTDLLAVPNRLPTTNGQEQPNNQAVELNDVSNINFELNSSSVVWIFFHISWAMMRGLDQKPPFNQMSIGADNRAFRQTVERQKSERADGRTDGQASRRATLQRSFPQPWNAFRYYLQRFFLFFFSLFLTQIAFSSTAPLRF